jgi:hypothetical protein
MPRDARSRSPIAPISEDGKETDRSARDGAADLRGPGVLILLIGAFGGWAATAPLAGGAVANA